MLALPLLLLLTPLSVLTRPTSSPRSTPNIQTIHQFSGVTLENLAPRSNGHLLLTATNQPHLYDIDPRTSSSTPITLPDISGVHSILGIAETAPDVFAVAAGIYDTSNEVPTFGSFSVWSVNMNTAQPTVKLITAIPEAQGLNGLAALNGFSGTVLVADSILGAVWKVNVATGAYSMAIQNSNFAPSASAPVGHSLGINGLRTVGNSLYFTNSAQGIFGSIRINPDGSAAGEVEVLATRAQPSELYDDFDMDPAGNAWITTHAGVQGAPGIIYEVTRGGVQTSMTGEGTSFNQPTSARFGRGSQSGTLYVVDAANGQLTAVTNAS